MITLALTEQELQLLAGLITAGGKSPNTGAEAMVGAANMLGKLEQARLAAQQKAQATPEAPKLNGRAAEAEAVAAA